MSKDPFEELFGEKAAASAAPDAANAAREASYRGAATQQLQISAHRSRAWLPWVVVAVIAAVIIGAAAIFLNVTARPPAKPQGQPESGNSQSTDATAVDKDRDSEDAAEVSDAPMQGDEAAAKTEQQNSAALQPGATAPKIDPGHTVELQIPPAGISLSASGKLEPNKWWFYDDGTQRIRWNAQLMNAFPDSCAQMRSPEAQSPWGLEKDQASGKWQVMRPAGTCKAAPELYDQVWGLLQAMADSAKPLPAEVE